MFERSPVNPEMYDIVPDTVTEALYADAANFMDEQQALHDRKAGFICSQVITYRHSFGNNFGLQLVRERDESTIMIIRDEQLWSPAGFLLAANDYRPASLVVDDAPADVRILSEVTKVLAALRHSRKEITGVLYEQQLKQEVASRKELRECNITSRRERIMRRHAHLGGYRTDDDHTYYWVQRA